MAKRKQYRTEAGAGRDGYQQWWCFATKSFSHAVELAAAFGMKWDFLYPPKKDARNVQPSLPFLAAR
jgi:hypothetical protein